MTASTPPGTGFMPSKPSVKLPDATAGLLIVGVMIGGVIGVVIPDVVCVIGTVIPVDVVNVCVVVFKVVPLASVIVMGTTGAIAAGAAATGVAAAAAVTVLVGSTTAVSRVCADASAAFSPGAAAFCGPGAGVGL